jgi:hypothetical protein
MTVGPPVSVEDARGTRGMKLASLSLSKYVP